MMVRKFQGTSPTNSCMKMQMLTHFSKYLAEKMKNIHFKEFKFKFDIIIQNLSNPVSTCTQDNSTYSKLNK